ncbi:AI-2E family transporter [Halarcobacter bivalviorum]|uniref:AI-2E family transporter n=1 Tax=Halarcobacter bivalviorum TaxID=663364 RepID=A0AAX2A5S0_9BACT|nr:AI-2E family transporter [Halarcobacter bivalviorum]AXH11517.1 acid membrane antigen A [Halarcobacter bivalviorum]RXK09300.1 AI-2E family transporter [Halarcobacter bivalviorum]
MKPQYFLIALTAVTLFFMFELFSPFLKPMFVALLLAVATNSLNIYLKRQIPSQFISSMLMTIFLTAIFFIPILYCIFSFATMINKIDQKALIEIYNAMEHWVKNMPNDLLFIKEQLNKILDKIDIPQLIQNLISFGAFLGKNSAKFIIDMIMILIFYFFFNYYSTSLSHYFKEAMPLKKEDSNALFYESSNVMSVVLYSILVTAVFEGLLFGFFVSFFGYDGILLGVLYGFASLVPVVGGLIMWLPVAIYEIFTGSTTNAIAIVAYSIIVISIIADTFIKPIIIKYINQRVVKTPSAVNELLIFFAIVAGLSTFGFWGMIIGPAMVTFFISLIQLLNKFSDDFYSIKRSIKNE